jgi:predicted GIY-YIG superfamily endonuclease
MATISQRGIPRPDRSPNPRDLEYPGVYLIACPEQNIGYIGSARVIRHRYTQHWACMRRGVHQVRELQRIYDEEGVDALEFRVLEAVSGELEAFDKHLLALEGEWIARLSKTMTLTNLYKRDDTPMLLTGRLSVAPNRTREYLLAHPHVIDEQIGYWLRLQAAVEGAS